MKDTHLEHATRNYQRWLRSQDAQGRSWPDNVQFFHDDLANVSQHISKEVDAVSSVFCSWNASCTYFSSCPEHLIHSHAQHTTSFPHSHNLLHPPPPLKSTSAFITTSCPCTPLHFAPTHTTPPPTLHMLPSDHVHAPKSLTTLSIHRWCILHTTRHARSVQSHCFTSCRWVLSR